VGWYLCPWWDDGHGAKEAVPFAGLEAMRDELDRQAARLSTHDILPEACSPDARRR
jgi:hypothetical protein